MPSTPAPPSRSLQGRIVQVEPRAERYTRWVLLTAEEGFLPVMAAHKLALPYGLFDRVELQGSSRGKSIFLKEVYLLHRPSQLAVNLPGFTEASHLAELLQKAFDPMPDYAPIADIFERALGHYEKSKDAELITLKALYKILEAEGFPVAEDWLASLSTRAQKIAIELLYKESSQPAEESLKSLLGWMKNELQLRV